MKKAYYTTYGGNGRQFANLITLQRLEGVSKVRCSALRRLGFHATTSSPRLGGWDSRRRRCERTGRASPLRRRPAVPVASETRSYRVCVVSTGPRRRGQRQRFRRGWEIPLRKGPIIAILYHRETGP